MGLDVRIEGENGTSVAGVSDNDGALSRALTSLVTPNQPLLSGIDIYMDTLSNRKQVAEVIKELNQIAPSASADEFRRIQEIKAMVAEWMVDSHVYLRFVGD